MNQTLNELSNNLEFIQRHVGPDATETEQMLKYLGLSSLDDMLQQTVPNKIRLPEEIKVPSARSEQQALTDIKAYADMNEVFRSYIGMGYYPTRTPTVILRNVLENPGWYTAYTPYQPEIAQGRLEAILTYQQMTIDLTGMELASASLLDEASAAAEAMAMAKRVSKNKKSNLFFVDENAFPQTVDVIKTRAEHYGFELVIGNVEEAANHDVFGAYVQYTNRFGEVIDLQNIIAGLQANKAVVAVGADIMSLVMLKAPGEMGADIVLGSSQRFGVPIGFGGPHAAFFATREKFKRAIPGRIIGVSIDTHKRAAYRMAMQTREQHIRREKATSNICTAQVLLANIAAFYAVYHGPEGLRQIAYRIHRMAGILAQALNDAGVKVLNKTYFDTLSIDAGGNRDAIIARATEMGINLRIDEGNGLGMSLDETTTTEHLQVLYSVLTGDASQLNFDSLDERAKAHESFEVGLLRETPILQHPVFNTHRSETEMLRFLKHLENKDLSLTHAMIALGSCTMKLNSTSEMIPISWPGFAAIHPFAPVEQTLGYQKMIEELEDWLATITGYDAVSMQPNSGAQGEYAGLLAIKKYHESRGEGHRNICLIPSSAHGTNPASAQMINMKVVIVNCDEQGNVDYEDLKTKAETVSENLACLMITYPSTHGVFEEAIKDICALIHEHGGQVYMDGANMNAQVGITSPGLMGSDVSHLNLHKTFAIPHGGGGPGVGPIGVKAHLKPYLPNHSVRKLDSTEANGAVSAAPYGSAGVLPISWMYVAMLGKEGLKRSTEIALLSANYLATKLSEHYPILYTGRNNKVAHECIVDLRPIKAETGITEVDIAKRLMDYGFHAPTMSFPVAGTLMIEPTESESLCEIERFASAMISIKQEVEKVRAGDWPADNNPLANAPHTQADLLDWNKPYSIKDGVYPVEGQEGCKLWPTVNRIDDVYGDRNLMCACPSPEDYR